MFKPEQIAALSAKLDKGHVKKNPRGFDYVEGWHAIAEANRIFGFDGWDREAVELRQLGTPEQDAKGQWRVAYYAKVRVTVYAGRAATPDEWLRIVREGCGFGSGIDRDVGRAHESALKEAETDAMKRALMTFGNPFGLALYDKEQNGVEKDLPVKNAKPASASPVSDDLRTLYEDLLKGVYKEPSVQLVNEYLRVNKADIETLRLHAAPLFVTFKERVELHRGNLSQKPAA